MTLATRTAAARHGWPRMKLGVFTVLFGDLSLEEALDRIVAEGVDHVEIGTGNYPGTPIAVRTSCSPTRRSCRLPDAIASRDLKISALSCHGNPLHPMRDVGDGEPRDVRVDGGAGAAAWVESGEPLQRLPGRLRRGALSQLGDLRLAERVPGAPRVAVGRESDPLLARRGRASRPSTACGLASRCIRASWSTTPARCCGCATRAAGDRRQPRSDPPLLAGHRPRVRVAVRDCGARSSTCTPRTPAGRPAQRRASTACSTRSPAPRCRRRSWIFRTVGYGHGEPSSGARILSALRLAGYDDVLSIEHEDALLSIYEGFSRGVAFLRSVVMPAKPPGQAWWT